jgi:hypothetical protein
VVVAVMPGLRRGAEFLPQVVGIVKKYFLF